MTQDSVAENNETQKMSSVIVALVLQFARTIVQCDGKKTKERVF